ncbi:MAG: hypothetical protein ACUVQ1_01290 [Candidatus Kapaibacteriales bacterium]
MKKSLYSIIFSMLFIIFSCTSKDETPVTPQPNITAKISGSINMDYQGSGIITQGTLYNALSINIPSTGKFSGKTYSLGIFLINKDFKEKTGTFIFSNKDLPADYAVGLFEIFESGGTKKSFFADSGIVIITHFVGNSITGTFNFRAIDANSNDTIWAMKGSISF